MTTLRNTKFVMAVGAGIALLLVFGVLALKDKLSFEIVSAWLVAFVGIPVQYGISNVKASGQIPPTS